MPAVEAGPFGDSKKVPMTQTVEKNIRFAPGQKIFAGQHLLLALEVLNPPFPVRHTALANVAGPRNEADAQQVKFEENFFQYLKASTTELLLFKIIQIIPNLFSFFSLAFGFI